MVARRAVAGGRGANRDGEPQLFKIPVGGGTPVSLVKEYSTDPIWAPSGQFLVYSGADVGTTFSVKAVSADGSAFPLPEPDSHPGRQAAGLSWATMRWSS